MIAHKFVNVVQSSIQTMFGESVFFLVLGKSAWSHSAVWESQVSLCFSSHASLGHPCVWILSLIFGLPSLPTFTWPLLFHSYSLLIAMNGSWSKLSEKSNFSHSFPPFGTVGHFRLGICSAHWLALSCPVPAPSTLLHDENQLVVDWFADHLQQTCLEVSL